jgi:hypothetical protein
VGSGFHVADVFDFSLRDVFRFQRRRRLCAVVVSNAGDGRARNVAWQFEQIRAAIQIGWPWARVQLDRPVIVVAAKDENSMPLWFRNGLAELLSSLPF